MATRFEPSPRLAGARQRGSRWRSLLATPHAPTREEIERDAAAQLGVPADLVGGAPTDAPAPEAAENATAEPEAAEHAAQPEATEHATAQPEAAEPTPAVAGSERRRGRLSGWWRDLVSPEPAEARRQRLEAEAASELGLHDGPEHDAR